MITREEFQTIYDQGPDAVYALIVTMQAQIDALTARVQELEARLNKDSHNSSKPPSSDGLAKKPPAPKSLRPKTDRRSGGQRGHPGRTLLMVETPDQRVVHRPAVCCGCGSSLQEAVVVGTERRQVFDLPPLRLQVTEHQVPACVCPHCHAVTRGSFPPEAAQPVQYGPGVLSLCVYLSTFQLLPYARTRQLLADLFGQAPSEGTLARALETCHQTLAPVEAAVKEAVTSSEVGHFDETGVRVGKNLHWLHVASTRLLTFYARHAKRGREALADIDILGRFRGVSVHDAWAPYLCEEYLSGDHACQHALCNAHVLRELTGLWETTRQTWTQHLAVILLLLKKEKEAAQGLGMDALPRDVLARYVRAYHHILQRGLRQNPAPPRSGKRGRTKRTDARNLLERLRKYWRAVLRFAYDFAVPFDNNQAERDLRMVKVRQKVSGCFRSEAGAAQFCRIRGYISTLRKQGRDILTALQSAFKGQAVYPCLNEA